MESNKLGIKNPRLSEMMLESVPNYTRETILTTILIFIIIVALLVLIEAPSFMWLFYMMITLGLFIGVYDCFCFKKKINEIDRIKADIKSRIMAAKFRYWRNEALVNFFNKNFHVSDSNITDKDYEELLYVISEAPINNIEGQEQISENILAKNGKYKKIWCLNTEDQDYNINSVLIDNLLPIYISCYVNSFMCDKSRNFILRRRKTTMLCFGDEGRSQQCKQNGDFDKLCNGLLANPQRIRVS